MRLRKTIFAFASTAGIAALLTLTGVVSPSPASASLSSCPTDYFCGWTSTSYGGSMFDVSKNTTGCIDISGSNWTDNFESFANLHPTKTIWLVSNANCVGPFTLFNSFQIDPNTVFADLTYFKNKTKSMYIS